MSYDEIIAQLATVADAYAAERAGIDAWYDSQCAAARESLAEADERLAAAEAALTAAGTAVEITDTEAARLWGVLADRMKVPVSTLGPPPAGDTAGDAPEDPEHPARLLDRVRELLDEAGPAKVPARLLRVLLALLLLALIAGAVAGTLLLRR
jgi:hypothetical protein